MTLTQYLDYARDVMQPTETLFQLVPADKIEWKPTEKSFTVGQLTNHIAGALHVYTKGIARGEWGFTSMREIFVANRRTPTAAVEQALALYQTSYANFFDTLSSLTEEDFSVGEVDTPQLGKVPRWRIAMLGLEHHSKHLAELFMYLKILGVQVNTGHLYAAKK